MPVLVSELIEFVLITSLGSVGLLKNVLLKFSFNFFKIRVCVGYCIAKFLTYGDTDSVYYNNNNLPE